MPETRRRGFAAMNAVQLREIASKGGRTAHAKGTAHRFTPEEARAAGRKGGQAAHPKRGASQFTPDQGQEGGGAGLARPEAPAVQPQQMPMP